MRPRDREHLIVPKPADRELYTPPGGGGSEKHQSPGDRRAHGKKLASELASVEHEGLRRRKDRSVQVEDAIDGIYVEFEGFPGLELALESLDPQVGRLHPELVSVRSMMVDGELTERATVFLPDGTLGRFVRQVEQYLDTLDRQNPRYRKLLDSVRSVGLASLSALWTDPAEQFPLEDAVVWWEVWLRRRDGHEIDRLRVFSKAVGAKVHDQRLGFADRTVVLVQATASQLAGGLDVLDDLAELRRPREPGALVAQEPPEDQAAWAEELVARTRLVGDDKVAACILDTGVHRAHLLLEESLAPGDCHTCNPTWGVDDRRGHGTEMAGLVLYGDLEAAIRSAHPVELRHRLESVKILPNPPGTNPPELWGAITATAASLVELQAPARRRAFSMAVTAESFPAVAINPDPISLGQPTSWSATIDALAAGRAVHSDDDGLVFLDEETDAAPRLFIVSAGNIRTLSDSDYIERCDVEPVEDPAQSWNSVTVGAFTDLDDLSGAQAGFDGWQPVADREGTARADDHGSFNKVFYFPDITRPVILHQRCDYFRLNMDNFFTNFSFMLMAKMFHQQRDVFFSITEWGRNDRKYIESVE